jgi:vacuolar-type H+-ATPase subunit D/Vma8
MNITEKELEEVREQQTKIAEIKQDLGTLEMQKHEILHVLVDINKEVNDTKKALEEKYGRVNINLDDGSYADIKEIPSE